MSSEDGKPPEANTEKVGDVPRHKLDWGDVELTFSDWVLIQPAYDDLVILSFFQGEYPFRTREEYERNPELLLHCMARLVVSPQQFERILALYTDFQRAREEVLKAQKNSPEQIQKEGE